MKRIVSFCTVLLMLLCLAVPAYAYNNPDLPRVVDEAQIISEGDEAILQKKIDEVSEKYNFDIVIVTVRSTGSKSAEEYADDYYDYNGYGCGEDNDGILYLLNMGSREFWLSTTGYGIDAFNDFGIRYLNGNVTPYLKSGDYYTAFTTLIDTADAMLGQAADGSPYGSDLIEKYSGEYRPVTQKDDEPDVYTYLFVCAVISLIVAFIVTRKVKRSYSPVCFSPGASSYIVPGSVRLRSKEDDFLYSTVTKTRIQEDSSSSGGHSSRGHSGGSSTHVSSSGTTHGGGGGHF